MNHFEFALAYRSAQVELADFGWATSRFAPLLTEYPTARWSLGPAVEPGFNDHRSAVWPLSVSVVQEELDRLAADEVLDYCARHAELMQAACDAEDCFDLDELEAYAEQRRPS